MPPSAWLLDRMLLGQLGLGVVGAAA